jgi:transcription antitermination protein NusB
MTMAEVTSSMSARRKARKRALDVLYEADLRRTPITDSLAAYVERLETPRPEQLGYTVAVVEGVAQHLDRVDELIASYAEGWTLERMPVVDRNLARIAVYELVYVDEIDDAVAITEAVELAKTLSTEDSPRFLNGLLGRIAEYASR